MKRVLKNLWSNTGFPWRLARIMLLLAGGLTIFIMAFEDKFIYFPSKYPDGFWEVDNIPAREGEVIPKVEDCSFVTNDGVRLHGWYCTPHRKSSGQLEPLPAEMVLLWFHGNAGNISYRYDMIRAMMELPVHVFIIDYRGYGKSTGRIESEAQLHADVRAAWDAIAPGYRSRNLPIVIYGRSLGTGLAAYLARDVNPALLMLVTPFTSLAAAASRAYPLVPGWILKYPLRTDAIIGEVKSPVLLVHGNRDALIPLSDSEQLRALARSPAELLVIEGAGHNDIQRFPTYLEGLAARLNQLAGK